MSDVVPDASFLVKLLVEEPGSRLSKATFEAYEHAATGFSHAYAEVLEVVRRKLNKGLPPFSCNVRRRSCRRWLRQFRYASC